MTFHEVMKLTRTVSSHTALEDCEALALYACCTLIPENGFVVETGCELGRSSSIIAQVGKTRRYFSLHIDPYDEHPEYMQQWIAMMAGIGSRYVLARTSTAKHGPIVGPVDLAFIDGDHSQVGVQIDTTVVAERVRSGGLLAAHDYGRDSLPAVKETMDVYIGCGGWEPVDVFGTLGVWRRK